MVSIRVVAQQFERAAVIVIGDYSVCLRMRAKGVGCWRYQLAPF